MRGRDVQRTRRRRAGFTVVEVMVSLGIMTVGAMGIIALQTHAIRSNGHARQLTIGMQIAQRWVERLKQDTHTWNVAGVPGTVLANTRYLGLINTAPNVFSPIPNSATVDASRAFDYRGQDIVPESVDPPVFYCAAMRPAWVYFGRAMRVDVRVWWPREGFEMSDPDNFPRCEGDPADLEPGGAATTLYNRNAFHVVYLSTVLRLSPLR